MIPPLHYGEMVRLHQADLRAHADQAHLTTAAKAARHPHPHLFRRAWSSLVWVGRFLRYRHTEPEIAASTHRHPPLAGSAS